MAFHLSDFVPANVVTALVITQLREQQVMRNLVRNSNKANVGPGASYKVPGVGSITIGTYAGTDITTQALTDTSVTVTINQHKYFAFYADEVDTEQAAYDVLPLYIEEATHTLANSADSYIASVAASGASLSVSGVGITESNVSDWVADIKKTMDEANVPQAGRWLVVPPHVAASVALSNIETASTTDERARLEGFVQRYLGFDMYMSNNLDATVPSSGVVGANAIAGIPNAIDFIDSVNSVSMQPAEKRFATQVKGLHVYGCSVTQGNAVCVSNIWEG